MDPNEAVRNFPAVIPDTAQFIKDLEDTEMEPGSTVTITCSVVSAGTITITCGGRRFDTEAYKEQGEKMDEESGKQLNWASVEISSEKVMDYAPRDFKCYCQAWSFGPKEDGTKGWVDLQSRHAKITVVETVTSAEPYLESSFKRGPRDQTVEGGDEVEFTCVPPMGEPTPQVTWMKDGRRLSEGDRVTMDGDLLVIEGVRAEDIGMYSCVATNEAGSETSREAMLSVIITDPDPTGCNAERIQGCLKDQEALSDPTDMKRTCKVMSEVRQCVMQIMEECPSLASIGQDISQTWTTIEQMCGSDEIGGSCGMARLEECSSQQEREEMFAQMTKGDVTYIIGTVCPTVSSMMACMTDLATECPDLREMINQMVVAFQGFETVCDPNAEPDPTGSDYTTDYYGTDYPDGMQGSFPVFTEDPAEVSYILHGNPVTLKCNVFYAVRMDFECNGKTVEASIETASSIVHHDNTKAVSNELTITQDMLNAWKEPTPYTCHCNAYYTDKESGQLEIVSSAEGTVQIAYLEKQFEMEPEGQNVMSGQEVTLRCKAPAGVPRPTITWSKDGFLVGETSRITLTDSGSLMIQDFTAQDQGSYVCIVKNMAGQMSSDTALVMLDDDMEMPDVEPTKGGYDGDMTPPGETDMAIPGTAYISKELKRAYYLVKNKPVELSCEAYNVERISIHCGGEEVQGMEVRERSDNFQKSDGSVAFQDVKTGSVTIRKKELRHFDKDAKYLCQCMAYYRVAGGELLVKMGVEASIEEARIKNTVRAPDNQFPMEGESVTLRCGPHEGNPAPEISFMKEDSPVVSDGQRIIIIDSNTLIITEVSMEDSGRYKCVAENVAGRRDSAYGLLEVSESDGAVDEIETTQAVQPSSTAEPTVDEDEGSCTTEKVTECYGHAKDKDGSDPCMVVQDLQACAAACQDNANIVRTIGTIQAQFEAQCQDQGMDKGMDKGMGGDTDMDKSEEHTDMPDKEEKMETTVSECEGMNLCMSQMYSMNQTNSDLRDLCSSLAIQARENATRGFVQCMDSALYSCDITGTASSASASVDEWFSAYCEYFFTDSLSFQGCAAIDECSLSTDVDTSMDNNTYWCSMYNSIMECTESSIDTCALSELKNKLVLMDEMSREEHHCAPVTPEPEPETSPEPSSTVEPEVVDKAAGKSKEQNADGGASSVSSAVVLATCIQIVLAVLLS